MVVKEVSNVAEIKVLEVTCGNFVVISIRVNDLVAAMDVVNKLAMEEVN